MARNVFLASTLWFCLFTVELAAQQPQPSALRRAATEINADSARLALDSLRPKGPSRWQHARKGALIGAVALGLTGALLAYTQVNVGCNASGGDQSCHEDRQMGEVALWGGAMGTMFGGISGAIVGFAWPIHPSQKPAAAKPAR